SAHGHLRTHSSGWIAEAPGFRKAGELKHLPVGAPFVTLRQSVGTKTMTTNKLTDVAIVIALKEEFEELYRAIEQSCRAERDLLTGNYDYLFEHPGGKEQPPFKCVATFAGEMGPTESALETERLMRKWNPRNVVNLGIAAGIHKDVNVGD